MNPAFIFELNKVKEKKWVVMFTTAIIQLVFLYFFTIISRFDSSSTDEILQKYSGLMGLATTLTTCVLTMYGTILVNRLIVTHYVGDSRNRLYLYPAGRGELYYNKNVAFIVLFMWMQFLGFMIANILYISGESVFPMLDSTFLVLRYFIDFVMSALGATALTISMILLSSIIGILLKSSVATVVTGVIAIVCLSNLMAMSFANGQLFSLIVAVFILILTFVSVKATVNRINRDEV